MGDKGMYDWNKDQETYMRGESIIKNKDSLFATIFGSDFEPTNIMPFYSSIPDWDGSGGGQTENYNDIINLDFIKMTEETTETYLKENLPEGFTFDQYGVGDAIKVMYGDKSVKINLQPNTTSGERKNIKKLQDFIKEVMGTGNFG